MSKWKISYVMDDRGEHNTVQMIRSYIKTQLEQVAEVGVSQLKIKKII